MSKDTNPVKKEEKNKKILTKIDSKTETILNEKTPLPKETKEKEEDKTFHPVENKSIQNKIIDNIKSFISKIIDMQEKVRKDEEEEKQLKQAEESEKKQEITIKKESQYLLEYYDLPFRYNETIVKILAQTPKRLFVYWDVSDKDKQTYLNAFGDSFFKDTYPVLLVHNEDKNYTSEIAINDFANSWYLDILDPRDHYSIQLGRKFKNHIKPQINPEIEETNISLQNDYLMIAMSNQLEVPNDHILFEEFKPYIKYRNVKTHQENVKNVTKTIYKNKLEALYKELYPDEMVLDEYGKFDLQNPSSMGTSSSFISPKR